MLTEIERAASAVAEADNIFIGAGAGMGVDSGLPDFRGNEGFWKAYPPFRGKPFSEMANPKWFREDPALAWGFYGHRLNLYRETIPHAGFQVLHQLCQGKSWFVFTSNVDGHFQKAGFDEERILECHGSIHYLQCTDPACCRQNSDIWPAEEVRVQVNETTFRAQEPLPLCVSCGKVARPNILMFSDSGWLHDRAYAQQRRFKNWVHGLTGKTVVIECGAGTAIPSVRLQCEDLVDSHDATLIRINVREPEGPQGIISIDTRASEALAAIQSARRQN
jgi:NAD-dependent SIR2 family protein deacetylase